MKKGRHWIVSNYNYDPTEVVNCLDATFEIFDQSEKEIHKSSYFGSASFRSSLHSGHNISDYLCFIIENYYDLPSELGFIKGNIFPRHISKKIFLERIKRTGFVPLYGDQGTYVLKKRFFMPISQQVAPGLYVEINNGWYIKKRPPGRYYQTLDELHLKLFGRVAPRYNLFVPGACMLVPASNIVRWPRSMFEHLYEITTYRNFPVEAFHVERSLFLLFGAEQI